MATIVPTAEVEKHKKLYFASMFTCGLANNLGFCMVMVASQQIAQQFGQDDLMPLFFLCLLFFANFIIVMNVRFLSQVSHMTRININIGIMLTSYCMISYACGSVEIEGFVLAMIASMLMGLSWSFGEATLLGVLKFYPPDFLAGWSSGQGCAGVIGSSAFLFLRGLGFADQQIFWLGIPVTLSYYLAASQLIANLKGKGHDAETKSTGNAPFSMGQVQSILQKAFVPYMNLMTIYFVQYLILSCFADRVSLRRVQAEPSEYVRLQLCYQIGVFFARLAITLIKIKPATIISVSQIINGILWFWNALYGLFSPQEGYLLIVWVGIVAGTGVANNYFQILNSDNINFENKEAALATAGIFVNFGIMFSSLVSLWLNITILS